MNLISNDDDLLAQAQEEILVRDLFKIVQDLVLLEITVLIQSCEFILISILAFILSQDLAGIFQDV